MSERFRMLNDDEMREFDVRGLDDFQDILHRVKNEFCRDTGKWPTHHILGKKEQSEWSAMVYLETMRGLTVRDPNYMKRQFAGLDVLFSQEKSLMIASTNEDLH